MILRLSWIVLKISLKVLILFNRSIVLGKSVKHYHSSDNGFKKIKKLEQTKTRQKMVQIPLDNDHDDDNDFDDVYFGRNFSKQ